MTRVVPLSWICCENPAIKLASKETWLGMAQKQEMVKQLAELCQKIPRTTALPFVLLLLDDDRNEICINSEL